MGILKALITTLIAWVMATLAGICIIGVVGCILILLFSSEARSTPIAWMALLFFAVTFILALKVAQAVTRRHRKFVEKVNRREGLALDAVNLLGSPWPTFIAFDRRNRRLAICTPAMNRYVIQEFRYVLGWHYEWRNVETAYSTAIRPPIPRASGH